MSRFFFAMLTLCAMLFTGVAALADDAGKLGVKVNSMVSGNDMPGLTIEPQADVKSLVIKLKRGDGKSSQLSASNVSSGSTKELPVQQEPGTFEYEGNFSVTWGDNTKSTFKMKFSLTRAAKLALTIKPEDVDLDARKMAFTINNPAGRAELTIVGAEGKVLKTVKKAYNKAPAGTKLEISWPDPGAELVYMDLKVYDAADFWKGVRLTPFSISIPHDDVVFESGKWNIRESEEHKLEATMGHIRANLEKHGTLLTLKLFIAGYTDTVGSKPSNETLSQNRARSIAAWFRKNGLKIPISYQGFGERVLAVQTPDETDEEKNRRAVYILSSQIPGESKLIPDDKWKAL